jgi:hypothetical protein
MSFSLFIQKTIEYRGRDLAGQEDKVTMEVVE